MQVEDVMFVDEKKLVALEYIFYQKKGTYSKIENDKDAKHSHPLGTDEYKNQIGKSYSTAFKNAPVNYCDSKTDYLKEHAKSTAPLES